MTKAPPDELLREMAQHRGFKLLKSRRRKAGTGDYGKFGLTDAAGKALLGITDEGLTASAADIENFLRTGAVSTWRESAKLAPDRPPRVSSARKELAPKAVPPRAATRKTGSSDPAPAQVESAARSPGRQRAREKLLSPQRPTPKPEISTPKLVVRPAKPADFKALGIWLSATMRDQDSLLGNLQLVSKTGGLAVALLGELIGCCAWALIPTVQHGLVGRITLILVEERHRRKGIGRQLLKVGERSLAAKGCNLIEVMSDIEVRNNHGFFRSLAFEQKSYRFSRHLAPMEPPKAE
jgi:ribosomal protein S18 acetylase RimI-like enzyme